jgi:hypothetical protein
MHFHWRYLLVPLALVIGLYLYFSGSAEPAGPPVLVELYPPYGRERVVLKQGEQTLAQALDNLSGQITVPIDRLWPGIETIAPEMIHIYLSGGPYQLSDALIVLQRAANDTLPELNLAFEWNEDRLVIGPSDMLNSGSRTQTQIYFLGDFLRRRSSWVDTTTHYGSVSRLTDVIKATVQPEQWRENGGLVGSISDAGDRLVITATPGMHWQIKQLLDSLLKP